jgi:hypothetical protein
MTTTWAAQLCWWIAAAAPGPAEPAPAPAEPAAQRVAPSMAAAEPAIPSTAAPSPDDAVAALEDVDVEVSGFAQVDAVMFSGLSLDELDGGTGQPLNETRLLVRRGRLRARAGHQLPFLHVGALLEIEGNTVNGLAMVLQKASLSASLPPPTGGPSLLRASVGLMKIPYGGELIDEPVQRLFAEQALVTRALFPGEHDLGLRLDAAWGALRASLAAMNGQPTGALAYPGLDPNAAKDVVGRIGVDTTVDVGVPVQVRAGVSGLAGAGFSAGQLPTKDSLVWRDQNEDGIAQASELVVIPGEPGEPSTSFSRSAMGGDLRLVTAVPVLGPLTVEGEVTLAVNLDRGDAIADPIATGRDARELGFRILVTQALSPWATVGVRYDEYNPDLDALDERAGRVFATDATVATWSFAAALQLPDSARLLVEYNHEDNARGRTAAGFPTTLPADRVIVRAEVRF